MRINSVATATSRNSYESEQRDRAWRGHNREVRHVEVTVDVLSCECVRHHEAELHCANIRQHGCVVGSLEGNPLRTRGGDIEGHDAPHVWGDRDGGECRGAREVLRSRNTKCDRECFSKIMSERERQLGRARCDPVSSERVSA